MIAYRRECCHRVIFFYTRRLFCTEVHFVYLISRCKCSPLLLTWRSIITHSLYILLCGFEMHTELLVEAICPNKVMSRIGELNRFSWCYLNRTGLERLAD